MFYECIIKRIKVFTTIVENNMLTALTTIIGNNILTDEWKENEAFYTVRDFLQSFFFFFSFFTWTKGQKTKLRQNNS